ncbi:MAG TPA: hypothetical protein VEA39_06860, partial [Methylophilaceae bacterium]|nr:hypothetical protein [Methylophilaceae bacterium]
MNKTRRDMAFIALLILISSLAIAPSRADDSSKPILSVQENLREMDKDKDGMVSVHEVRAALEARHG